MLTRPSMKILSNLSFSLSLSLGTYQGRKDGITTKPLKVNKCRTRKPPYCEMFKLSQSSLLRSKAQLCTKNMICSCTFYPAVIPLMVAGCS